MNFRVSRGGTVPARPSISSLKFVLRLYAVLICTALLSACGGGGANNSGSNGTGAGGSTGGSTDPNISAYSRTLYPLLIERCAACHAEAARAPGTPDFAHSNPINSLNVVTSKSLVNFSSPPASVLVQRLAADRHFCWSTCAEDASILAGSISEWVRLRDSGGTTPGTTNPSNPDPIVAANPADSVTAFGESVYPLVIQYCATCHAGNLPGVTALASETVKTAHDAVVNRNLASLTTPSTSILVTRLAVVKHYCWADCAENAARMESAITLWAQLATAPANGANRAPVAQPDTFRTQTNTQLVTGNVLLNDTDADSDTLAIVDATPQTSSGGTLVNNLNGTFTYTPSTNFEGNDTFTYSITDGKGGTGQAIVTITVGNVAVSGLTAQADNIKTGQNAPITITNLTANDLDPTGGVITIVSVDVTSQSGGQITLGNNNTVTYTPPQNFSGNDRFTYTIRNASAQTSIGTVTANVNTAPLAVSDAVNTNVNLRVTTGDVLANDRDTDNDLLQVITVDTASSQGGQVINRGNGIFEYDPPTGFVGRDSFAYIISDGRGSAATGSVFINVAQPVFRDDNRFLTFTNTTAPLFLETEQTALAYYRAVDPLDQRTTLNTWRNLVGFNIGADATATYINANDLGFSRVMFVRKDPVTGVISSYVENYLNLADAIARQNLLATVAMEYNVAPGKDPLDINEPKFMSFFVFGADGDRDTSIDLDGRGAKFVPGLCNVCHGDRPKAIVNGIYPDSGNTNARFIPWDLDTYAFSDATATVSRAAQEPQFKVFNQTVLQTNVNSAVKELVEGWYGGIGLPANTFNGQFVPAGWRAPLAPSNGTQLYLQVVAPFCRACHMMRGNALQSDLDFATHTKFMGYKSRTEHLVFDEGIMPLALQTFGRFWANPNTARTLAQLIGSTRLLENDITLTPGRPLANAGPFRTAALNTIRLNGNASVFTGGATPFQWTLTKRPALSTTVVQNATQAIASFIADVPGDYTAQLVVNDGFNDTIASAPSEVVVRVEADLSGVSFISDISPLFDKCAACHTGFDKPRFNNIRTLYDNAINYVNLNDPVNSPILRKPSGNHHGGGVIAGFKTPVSEKYQLMLRWILEGALDN